jgi:pimeloyl-ACP methyl ester carboxylesterase
LHVIDNPPSRPSALDAGGTRSYEQAQGARSTGTYIGSTRRRACPRVRRSRRRARRDRSDPAAALRSAPRRPLRRRTKARRSTACPPHRSVDLYGVADLKAFLRTTDAGIRSFFVAEFGELGQDPALLDEFSPLRDVDKIVSPLFVYAGQNDPACPAPSRTRSGGRCARGAPGEYMVAANEGHSADRRETKIELLSRTARFLEEHLR